MRKSIKNEKGFTLIELVMVIVILGILAATAIPKFVSLNTNAENSAAAGVTAALRGQITMLHARYLVNPASNDYTITNVIDIETNGITLTNADPNITTTSIGNRTFSWAYSRTAGGLGQIADPTG